MLKDLVEKVGNMCEQIEFHHRDENYKKGPNENVTYEKIYSSTNVWIL